MNYHRMGIIFVLPLLGMCIIGCIRTIDEEEVRIGVLERDCPVPDPPQVTTLGAPTSLEYPNGSLWIWEWLVTPQGGLLSNAAAFVKDANDVCTNGPMLFEDQNGSPAPFLALTEEELDANAQGGVQLSLRPTGGFVYKGVGYLFYEHLHFSDSFMDGEVVGLGMCVRATNAQVCDRVVVNNSTILWPADAPSMNRGGMVYGNTALMWGCKNVAHMTDICTLSGADMTQLLNPSAWKYWNGLNGVNGWVDDGISAASLSFEFMPFAVSPFGDEILITTLDMFDGAVDARVMSDPFEEFDDARRVTLFQAAPPEDSFLSGGRVHTGLSRDALTFYFSYATDNANAPGLHLARYRFNHRGTGE